MGYVVSAPLVIANDEGGRQVYIYAGQPVPANIPANEVKRLADAEFIVSDAPEEDDSSYPEGEPSDSWTVKQLRSYADAFDVDLGKATSKPDILAALA